MTIQKRDIRFLSKDEIMDFVVKIEEKSFKVKQIYDWLWLKGVTSFDQMSNLSAKLRETLKENFEINPIKQSVKLVSEDGSIKIGFKLEDDYIVEGVLIPSSDRITACVSSQVGCPVACPFCATSKLKFKRNLTYAEIFDQIFMLNTLSIETYGKKLSNVVFMGMGEPLLNLHNIQKAINIVSNPELMNFSASRITVSTIGIPAKIKALADTNPKFHLAVSLHSADQIKRNQLLHGSKFGNLTELVSALKYYYKQTQSRITYEYILFDNLNDTLDDAKQLAEFCRLVPSKVNIIEYNSTGNSRFVKPNEAKIKYFVNYLERKNIIVNLRKSKGSDIWAACGQLANKIS